MIVGGRAGPANVFPIESSPKEPSNMNFDQVVSVLVQGRRGGPVERYRVTSPKWCRAANLLGWSAVVFGAGEIAIGIVVFHQWLREGGWWSGILGGVLGVTATNVSEDTPVGTSLVSCLVWLGLVTFVVSLVTLLQLDGAKYLVTRDLEDCAPTVDDVCRGYACTCTTSDDKWDRCFDIDDCEDAYGSSAALLASSLALVILTAVAALLFSVGVKCKFFGGGEGTGGRQERRDPMQHARAN